MLVSLLPFIYLCMLQVLLQAKGNLQKVLGRDSTEGELAEATNMTAVEVRKHMEVGRAARNKLIKVSTIQIPENFRMHVCSSCAKGFSFLTVGVLMVLYSVLMHIIEK